MSVAKTKLGLSFYTHSLLFESISLINICLRSPFDQILSKPQVGHSPSTQENFASSNLPLFKHVRQATQASYFVLVAITECRRRIFNAAVASLALLISESLLANLLLVASLGVLPSIPESEEAPPRLIVASESTVCSVSHVVVSKPVGLHGIHRSIVLSIMFVFSSSIYFTDAFAPRLHVFMLS